ncbi:MAG: hypothetical protein IPK26_16830 [Planctomycetes bacterium]|nr:hypothetical protein [Planctomycetota bacterium]
MEPEREPVGPPESVRVLAATLRSRRHAAMLFDAVVDLLGENGWQETANDGAVRRLFRRDRQQPSLIVPWPLLELTFGSRTILNVDWMGLGDLPIVEPPPPPPPPKLRGLGPGEIRIHDGEEYVEIAYSEAGAKFETSRSHHAHPLAAVAPAIAAGGGNPIELLARFVAGLDPGRHGSGRVLLPAAMPQGAAGVWQCGLQALRRALFAGDVDRRADHAVADGLTGRALGFGVGRAQALSVWRAAVAANPPWPEPRPATPIEEPDPEQHPGAFLIRGPAPDVPMPDRSPDNVPAALLGLASAPSTPPSFGSWVPLIGAFGSIGFAARRTRRRGFTLIGQHVLAVVDLAQMEADMDRVDEVQEERLRAALANAPGGGKRWPCTTAVYRVGEHGRLAFAGSTEGPAWDAGSLDGDVIAHRVVRQRWSP